MPSSARITRPQSVTVPPLNDGLYALASPKPFVAEWPEPISQRIPARPMTKIAAPYATTAQLT